MIITIIPIMEPKIFGSLMSKKPSRVDFSRMQQGNCSFIFFVFYILLNINTYQYKFIYLYILHNIFIKIINQFKLDIKKYQYFSWIISQLLKGI